MESYIDEDFSIKIEDGIVFIEFFREHGDLQFAEKGIMKRIEITQGRKFPIVSDMRIMKTTTREGRQRMAQPDAGAGVTAVAIIVNSKVQQVIYNLFAAIYKAPAPARVFTSKESAVQWIQQFKVKSLAY